MHAKHGNGDSSDRQIKSGTVYAKVAAKAAANKGAKKTITIMKHTGVSGKIALKDRPGVDSLPPGSEMIFEDSRAFRDLSVQEDSLKWAREQKNQGCAFTDAGVVDIQRSTACVRFPGFGIVLTAQWCHAVQLHEERT